MIKPCVIKMTAVVSIYCNVLVYLLFLLCLVQSQQDIFFYICTRAYLFKHIKMSVWLNNFLSLFKSRQPRRYDFVPQPLYIAYYERDDSDKDDTYMDDCCDLKCDTKGRATDCTDAKIRDDVRINCKFP